LRRRSEALAQTSQAHFRAANALLFGPRRSMRVSLFDWHVQLGWKYRAASTRPWFRVESDPPEPD
jgi:hypothetical protein